jgi:D-glycero-alpha-D-manno-heptose 1-phosphate guanylyltransferase
MEVIILAGGFGTRLQSVVKDVPKPMAEINGKPFLEYLLEYLSQYSITKIILSVGYKQDVIKEYFQNSYKHISLGYSCEDEPLGTGGAIKQALKLIAPETKNVLVLNGDTFFQIDLQKLKKINDTLSADITISLKEMIDFDRYGAIKIESNLVKKFEEKKFYKKAYINAGVYMIKKNIFDTLSETKFSFEEFLEKNLALLKVCPYISNKSYFIDIGIPEDYEKAKDDFKNIF